KNARWDPAREVSHGPATPLRAAPSRLWTGLESPNPALDRFASGQTRRSEPFPGLLGFLFADFDLLDGDVFDRAAGGSRGAADGGDVADRLDGVEPLDDAAEDRDAAVHVGLRRGGDHEDAAGLVGAGLRVADLRDDAGKPLEPVRLGGDVVAGG